MSATAEHFASIDTQLSAAKAAWDEEKKALEQHIMTLETELAIRTKLHDEAILAKERAQRVAATFVSKLATCVTVIEEARDLAIAAGLYNSPPTADSSGVAAAKELIDAATGGANVST